MDLRKYISVLLTLFIIVSEKTALSYSGTNAPTISSRYAVVIEWDSGKILYQRKSTEVVPMASTTKIITAIVALENSNLSDIVTVTPKAASIHGSSIGLKSGQKVTMEELLYGLMLQSGNDCAIAIAEHIAGSVEKFCLMMDSKAFDIGAFNTHFSTPHGLDAEGHFTTAYDLALITGYALHNNVFARIVSSKEAVIDGFNGERKFHNINKILWKLPYADGVKTGYTGKAGKCLVTSVTYNDRRLICVVLNSPNRWNDSIKLMEYCLENYTKPFSIEQDKYYRIKRVNNGNRPYVRVGLDSSISLYLSDEEYSSLVIREEFPDTIDAEVHKGQQIGKLVLYSNNREIYSIPFKALEDVRK
jgi:D-alanyl-D-alanine carboxypeptidase